VAAELRYGAAKHAATGDGGVARRAASLVFGTESRATSRDPIVTDPPALREDLRLGEFFIESRKRRENSSTISHM
jgi:hypothetical protein